MWQSSFMVNKKAIYCFAHARKILRFWVRVYARIRRGTTWFQYSRGKVFFRLETRSWTHQHHRRYFLTVRVGSVRASPTSLFFFCLKPVVIALRWENPILIFWGEAAHQYFWFHNCMFSVDSCFSLRDCLYPKTPSRARKTIVTLS